MKTWEHGLRLAVAPSMPEEHRPLMERSAEHELKHQYPGIRDIRFDWQTVTADDPTGEFAPELVGWHFLIATGLVDDDDS